MNPGQELFHDDEICNQSSNESFEQIVERRIARRNFIKGAAASAGLLVINHVEPVLMTGCAQAAAPPPLTFTPIQLSSDDKIIVPLGYSSQVVIRWGDPLFAGTPAFDINNQTASNQAKQFGFNCDFIGFFPLSQPSFPFRPSRARRGLLVVNHEYTTGADMFPNYVNGNPTKEQVDIELAAHGLTIVEVEFQERANIVDRTGWKYNYSPYNRRTTVGTEYLFTGPAAGSDLLKTSADPTGTRVKGTLNNCSAGKTPWGTVLTCEENFNSYFANNSMLPTTTAAKRYIRATVCPMAQPSVAGRIFTTGSMFRKNRMSHSVLVG